MALTVSGPGLLLPREAAAVLGVGVRHLTRLARDGAVPYARCPGGSRRYRRDDIEGLLNERRADPRRHMPRELDGRSS